jgi:hypothetical protein
LISLSRGRRGEKPTFPAGAVLGVHRGRAPQPSSAGRSRGRRGPGRQRRLETRARLPA